MNSGFAKRRTISTGPKVRFRKLKRRLARSYIKRVAKSSAPSRLVTHKMNIVPSYSFRSGTINVGCTLLILIPQVAVIASQVLASWAQRLTGQVFYEAAWIWAAGPCIAVLSLGLHPPEDAIVFTTALFFRLKNTWKNTSP